MRFILFLQDLFYRSFAGLIKILGGLKNPPRCYALGAFMGRVRTRFGYTGTGWSRSRYLQTIQTILPQISRTEAEALLKTYWINHQKRFVELFFTRELTPENISLIVDFEGLEHLDKALARGKGVILPVPHIGNERLHHIALALKGYPMAVISSKYEDHSGYAQSVKIGASKRFHEVGYAGDNAWLLRMLKSNRVLQVASTAEAGSNGVLVQFLDQQMLLPIGWLRLAEITGAPVLLSALLRQADSRHLLTIFPEFELQKFTDKEAFLRSNVQRFMDQVAPLYRRRPDLIDWMSLTVRLDETRRSLESTTNNASWPLRERSAS